MPIPKFDSQRESGPCHFVNGGNAFRVPAGLEGEGGHECPNFYRVVEGMEAPAAHISKDGRRHLLKDHLICTARLASERASAFGAGEWGYFAGLWHDLGKYSEAFQKYLTMSNGEDHHVAETKGHVDHSTAGAQYAARQVPVIGHLLAYAISGHHSGLLDAASENDCLESKLKKVIVLWASDQWLQHLRETGVFHQMITVARSVDHARRGRSHYAERGAAGL